MARYRRRGPDGYPLGSDRIMRDAYGPLPAIGLRWWTGRHWEYPLIEPNEFEWSYTFNCWRALVTFSDGQQVVTSPEYRPARERRGMGW